MVNCTKCGAAVDHPAKTWKIKQTSVALYECPSCKTKWRSKFIEEPTASVPQLALPEPAKDLTSTVTKVDSEAPVIEAIAAVVEDHVTEPSKPTGIFEGIRSFLSSLLS